MLFDQLFDPAENLLPFDGVVNDYGCILSPRESQQLLQYFLDTVPWQHDEFIKTFTTQSHNQSVSTPSQHVTKHIFTERKVAWYAEQAQTYTYAGSTKQAHTWSPALYELKHKVEHAVGARFNACLLNLYHTGAEGMTWHSDSESEIVKGHPIASLSLGATRSFALKHKFKKQPNGKDIKRVFMLREGQLIVMRGQTQAHWLHSVPKMSGVLEPRINLTFRQVLSGESK